MLRKVTHGALTSWNCLDTWPSMSRLLRQIGQRLATQLRASLYSAKQLLQNAWLQCSFSGFCMRSRQKAHISGWSPSLIVSNNDESSPFVASRPCCTIMPVLFSMSSLLNVMSFNVLYMWRSCNSVFVSGYFVFNLFMWFQLGGYFCRTKNLDNTPMPEKGIDRWGKAGAATIKL